MGHQIDDLRPAIQRRDASPIASPRRAGNAVARILFCEGGRSRGPPRRQAVAPPAVADLPAAVGGQRGKCDIDYQRRRATLVLGRGGMVNGSRLLSRSWVERLNNGLQGAVASRCQTFEMGAETAVFA